MKKIYLGCGKRSIPGFIHIDFANYPNIDHVTDVFDLLMFGDNSIDLFHQIAFHFKYLKKLLRKVRFYSIHHYDWGDNTHENYYDFFTCFYPSHGQRPWSPYKPKRGV